MKRNYYQTESGALIPAVTEDEMHAVDRIAVEEYQLGILQMMENAGRNLAKLAGTFIKEATQKIVILAGTGGNGGGGLCCARHLLNHGYRVDIILVKEPGSYQSAAGTQLKILQASNANIFQASSADSILASAHLIIDALIGYSLKGAPKGVQRILFDGLINLRSRFCHWTSPLAWMQLVEIRRAYRSRPIP